MSRSTLSSIFHFGVRQKVLLILLSVLLIGLTVSGWMALKQEERDTLKEINQRGSDISRFVAKSLAYSVVGYDYHTLQLLIDEITFAEDIGYAKVVNVRGNTMAEAGESGEGKNPTLVLFNQDIRLEEEIIGSLTLGLSTESILKRLESQKFALIKREAFVILMIALGEFLALSFIIIRPVSVMSESLSGSIDENGKIVGKVPVISEDEFGNLARQFNLLSSQLNDANSQLQSKIELADKQLIHNNRQLVKQSEELQQLNEEFRKLSVTDSLTGLHNRRRFEELMKRSKVYIDLSYRLTTGRVVYDAIYNGAYFAGTNTYGATDILFPEYSVTPYPINLESIYTKAYEALGNWSLNNVEHKRAYLREHASVENFIKELKERSE